MEVIRDSNLKLEDLITKAPRVMVVVSTKWCNPCIKMVPTFEDLEKEIPDMKFFKVDATEDQPAFISAMGIRSVPTMLLYKDGILKDNINGARTKDELKIAIDRANK